MTYLIFPSYEVANSSNGNAQIAVVNRITIKIFLISILSILVFHAPVYPSDKFSKQETEEENY